MTAVRYTWMVAVTNLLSKYTILYGKVMTLVGTVQSVARRWTTNVATCHSVHLVTYTKKVYIRVYDYYSESQMLAQYSHSFFANILPVCGTLCSI